MAKTKVVSEFFKCTKCGQPFRGSESFHGEYAIEISGTKEVKLCLKCTDETTASWDGEPDYIRRQIKREIDYCISQHGIDKYADAKRTGLEKALNIMNNSTLFNGYNKVSGYSKDLNKLELRAREIIHGECKINFSEQVRLSYYPHYNYIVDGLIQVGKKGVILEFDNDTYWHNSPEQKEHDRHRDFMLTEYGGYRVVRIPESVIKYDKSRLMTLILDGMYGKKQTKTKTPLSASILAGYDKTIYQ